MNPDLCGGELARSPARANRRTFYFRDPNGIRLQIELKTKQDADSLDGDPDPVPYVRALLQRA